MEKDKSENTELQPYKEVDFLRYRTWRSLPHMFKNPPRGKDGVRPSVIEFLNVLGVDDPTIIELSKISTQTAFADMFGVHRDTLTDWNKKIDSESSLNDIRYWARKLSKNVASALYNNAIRKGFAIEAKLWFQLIEGWEEKQKVEHDYKGVQRIIVIQEKENGDSMAPDGEAGQSIPISTGQDHE